MATVYACDICRHTYQNAGALFKHQKRFGHAGYFLVDHILHKPNVLDYI